MFHPGKSALAVLACLVPCLLPLGTAHGAPQILGLAATAKPVPLHCQGATCAAELGTFCLQEEKPIPRAGTAYRLAPGSRVRLIHRAPDGQMRRLAPPAALVIRSARQFTAVRLSLPRQQLGPGRLFLSVVPGAVLVPGDPHRLSARAIADVTAMARHLAATGFAGKASDAGTAALNQLVNALPETRPPTQGERARALTAARISARSLEPATRRRVIGALGDCAGDFNAYMIDGLRACLARHHDDAMQGLTRRAWKRLAPGS